MFSEDNLLPLSALQHFIFCPRRCALVHLEQQWQENIFTVEGQNLHQKTHDEQVENRPGVRIVRGLRIHSHRLGLIGQTDVVEFRQGDTGIELAGAAGLWQPFPVEYKRGILKKRFEYTVQLCAQAICLEEMTHAQIPCGAIYYGKSKRRIEVKFDDTLRTQTTVYAEKLHQLFQGRQTPQAQYKKKCNSCSLYHRCMPKATGVKKKIDLYLKKAFTLPQETENP